MSTTLHPQRTYWSLERWHQFGEQCQEVHERLSRFASIIAGYRWSRAPHIDAFLRARDRLWKAMGSAQDVFALQHDEFSACYGGRLICIQRQKQHDWKNPRPIPVHLQFEPLSPTLSRAQWVALGCEVKAIDADVRPLWQEFQGTKFATKPRINHFIRVHQAISKAKCNLDGVCSRQHPDWDQFTRVFYGPITPTI